VLNVIASLNKSLEELSDIMKKYPQVMINVTVSNDKKDEFHTDNDIKEEIKKVEDILKDTGRVLVRPSGTEPLIRVMLEGEDLDIINKYANELALYIENKLK
ncbi:MAG: phosphoglucosamine mutase, partial [Bacilli bacterium]|nr:phosphoglucosamine mutase [Bacilli bacterium]